MPNESARMRLIDLHQHESPAGGGDGGAPTRPDGTEPPAGCRAGRLWRENGKVYYEDCAAGGGPVAVRPVWALPLSGRGGPVSILQAGKKREIAYIETLDELPPDSRRVAEEELERGVIMPVITAIRSVRQRFGNYYWDVETTFGPKRFLLASPETNSLRPRPDAIVLRDVSGNCYEIASVDMLDRNSRAEMERVL